MKHLLQYFTELSLHPKNAEELKGLILQLAVQGKLTAKWREENPDVEPASVLLERIQEEKAQLVKEKKKKKRLSEITEKEMPYKLPESWIWCRFDEIVINRDGERKPITKSDRVKGDYDYYGASGIIDKVENYIFDKDLLLIGEDGANLINRSTPIAFFARGKYWVNNHAHVLDATKFTILEYLEKYINSISLEDYITGMAQPKMPQKRMNIIPVPLPPLEEQKAIVKTVNQLFTEVEQLETLTQERIQLKEDFVTSALHQLHTGDTVTEWAFLQQHFSTFFTEESNIKKLRESILQLAVQGKLTHHWRKENPEVEPASVLLERIQEEKAQLVKAKKIKKEKPLPEITGEEMPYELPEGWVWCYLGNSMLKITDGTHHSPINIDKGKFKYVTAKNIKNGGVKLSNITYVTEEVHQEIYARCNPEAGDLLYIKDGATTGICCINNLSEEFSMLSSVALIKQPQQIIGEYLLSVFRSPYYYELMRAGMRGVAITRVTLKKLKESIIPIPPIEEQKAIVEKVNTLMSLCDQLEQAIQTSKATQEDWMRSSLREVFEREAETINN